MLWVLGVAADPWNFWEPQMFYFLILRDQYHMGSRFFKLHH